MADPVSPVNVVAPTPALAIAAGAVWIPLSALVVGLRLWGSRYLDDWLTLPALALLWGQCVCIIYGTAKHAVAWPKEPRPPGVDPNSYVRPQSLIASQLLYATVLIQVPCITLIKLSFIFFYRRVFLSRTSHSRKLSLLLWTIIAVLIAWCTAFFFAQMFLCGANIPLIWYGNNNQQAANCIPFTQFDQALAASDFILDLVVFLLPIPLVWRLNLNLGQRVGVLGVFSLGGLSIAASITRLVVFTYEDSTGITSCLYWTTLESGIALLASCLPSIFGLYNNWRRKLHERSSASGFSGSGSRNRLLGGFRRRNTGTSLGGKRERLNSGASAGDMNMGRLGVKEGVVVRSPTVGMEEMNAQSFGSP